jgi:hypothetical protein
MSRHIAAIKDLIFDEPVFDDDEEHVSKKKRKKSKTIEEPTTPVETIVFRDPAKRRKTAKVRDQGPRR